MTRPALLLVAQSARALATAAVRAGYAPVTVDFFADADTRELALSAERVQGGFGCGFRRRLLIPAIERALDRAGIEPEGAILGSGFEDRPRLIETIAGRWPLLGTPAAAVRAVKDPFRLASACVAAGIPHPEVRGDAPEGGGDWLVRRRGASGGTHVRPWAGNGAPPAGHVLTRRLPGRPVSAAVLCDGTAAKVVGFAEQVLAPTAEAPYRFGGVAGPVELPAAVAEGLARAAQALAPAFGLRGLVSLDAMVAGDAWWLLEVNPRPGASLDALDRTDVPLLRAHIEAVRGRAPQPRFPDATIRATAVVYASEDSSAPADTDWPDWILDRPPPLSRFRTGEPIATIAAEAASMTEAKERLEKRARDLTELLRGNAT